MANKEQMLASFEEKYGYNVSHLPIEVVGYYLVVTFPCGRKFRIFSDGLACNAEDDGLTVIYPGDFAPTASLRFAIQDAKTIECFEKLTEEIAKLRAYTEGLEDENANLRARITEFELRPPTEGGALYNSAKARFEDMTGKKK